MPLSSSTSFELFLLSTQHANGTLRLVEVGDGQVSDLVGWKPGHFAAIFYFAPGD